jgi:hypothetical protein
MANFDTIFHHRLHCSWILLPSRSSFFAVVAIHTFYCRPLYFCRCPVPFFAVTSSRSIFLPSSRRRRFSPSTDVIIVIVALGFVVFNFHCRCIPSIFRHRRFSPPLRSNFTTVHCCPSFVAGCHHHVVSYSSFLCVFCSPATFGLEQRAIAAKSCPLVRSIVQ